MKAMSNNQLVKAKLDEFFWEWLSLPESEKFVRQTLQAAKGSETWQEAEAAPNPNFVPRGNRGPSPPGSPLSAQVSSPPLGHSPPSASPKAAAASKATREKEVWDDFDKSNADLEPEKKLSKVVAAGTPKEIPRFWWPKRQQPVGTIPPEARQKIRDSFASRKITEIRTYQELEPIVVDVFGLSKYFAAPIFHKMAVFYDIVDASANPKQTMLSPSPVPITEQMLLGWCCGKIQLDDPVLTFYWVVKSEHNDWIEREDLSIFLLALLLTHPGLDFLRETQEFQDRYSDTVISRIFFVYDRKDAGRIYLSDLRRYKPSVIEAWNKLAEHDDIKMVRDFFSYEHFYVIYCTFWELDSDHDFLLDKDDLLKYDGHALSRRAIDRIFSEIPSKFTSGVPGRMGYDDFIRFLLCDQDRSTNRSVEYWFRLFDLDGDGCIRDHEMKYFYEEQVQRMECLNYETILFADIMCQMNDMLLPSAEGQFGLKDFKRRRKFAGTFFSVFSSLNKFLSFEHRDPFLAKQDQLDAAGGGTVSEWDRWCSDEYLRLAMEEGDEIEEDNTRTAD